MLPEGQLEMMPALPAWLTFGVVAAAVTLIQIADSNVEKVLTLML